MKYNIISNIQIAHTVDAKNEQEALDKHANKVELPSGYVENSWELADIKLEEVTK